MVCKSNLNFVNFTTKIMFFLFFFQLNLSVPLRIANCWTEQENHRTYFLKNGIPERDSQLVPLCQLFDGASIVEHNNVHQQFGDINEIRKVWKIRVRLGWDTLPDSRQKALQQLLRTKPNLQWEAVPDLLLHTNNFLSPITIYPIMIQCSLSPISVSVITVAILIMINYNHYKFFDITFANFGVSKR